MLRITLAMLFVCTSLFTIAQNAADSSKKTDDIIADKSAGSFIEVAAGIGNKSFSGHNPAVNATGVTSQLVYNPSVGYFHKSGFSFVATGFITNTDYSSGLYQTGLAAGYDHKGKNVAEGISYTRYLSDLDKYNNNALYQNEVYAYLKKSSGVIIPGLEFGYANGKYNESDIVQYKKPATGETVLVNDSTNNKTNYFSASVNLAHDFKFYKLFAKEDEFELTTSFVLNTGIDNNDATQVNPLYNKIKAVRKRKRVAATNKYELQSVALSADMEYDTGKFFLRPSVYVDYYLPSGESKRWSSVFSITAGFDF